MIEPYRTQFFAHLERGAAARDVHDGPESSGFAESQGLFPRPGSKEAFFEREVGRVALHQRSLLPLLERHVGKASRILDVGCSTGGTTVALALSRILDAKEVIGVDPNAASLEAATVRALGHGVGDHVRFQHIAPGRLPFEDASFDLVTCVSVLEFISSKDARVDFVRELQRVTRPGGYVYLATPSPLRVRELHTRRFLGDFRRKEGLPWATPGWELKTLFADWERIRVVQNLVKVVAGWFRWQKLLARRPK